MTIAKADPDDETSKWEIELAMPERRMGHVRKAIGKSLVLTVGGELRDGGRFPAPKAGYVAGRSTGSRRSKGKKGRRSR